MLIGLFLKSSTSYNFIATMPTNKYQDNYKKYSIPARAGIIAVKIACNKFLFADINGIFPYPARRIAITGVFTTLHVAN